MEFWGEFIFYAASIGKMEKCLVCFILSRCEYRIVFTPKILHTLEKGENVDFWAKFWAKILKIWQKIEKWNYNSNEITKYSRGMELVFDHFVKLSWKTILTCDFVFFDSNLQVSKGLDLPKFTKIHHNSNEIGLSFAEKIWKKAHKIR